MYIHFYSFVFPDDLSAFPYMAYSPLAQDIQFFKSDIFCNIHVPLGGWIAFWWKIKGSIARNGFFGNQDSPCVYAS